MQNLAVKATKHTPEINLNINGTISLVGKSYPENSFEFYAPMMKWVKEYFSKNPAPKTILNMEIIYFNSSSLKLFFDLFDLIEDNADKNDVDIKWIYDEENESAQEAGEDFIEDFQSLNINLVPKIS